MIETGLFHCAHGHAIMTERLNPEKISFTPTFLNALYSTPFGRRVVGQRPDGTLETVANERSDYFLGDATLPGFNVRVTSGKLTFYASRKLHGRLTRIKCGEWLPGKKEIDLERARMAAREALSAMSEGHHPIQKKEDDAAAAKINVERGRKTFGLMLTEDMARRAPYDRPKTSKDRQDVVKWLNRLPIWRMPIAKITGDDIKQMLDHVGIVDTSSSHRATNKVATQRKVLAYAKAAFNRLDPRLRPDVDPFADHRSASAAIRVPRKTNALPAAPMGQPAPAQREAWLRSVAALREASGPRSFAKRIMGDLILLTVLWGARRGEISTLTWDNIDFERAFVRFEKTKNGRDHIFPLCPGAAAILLNRRDDNRKPRGLREEKRVKNGEILPERPWVFLSEKRTAEHIVEPRRALKLAHAAADLDQFISMHDLRRTFRSDLELEGLASVHDVKRAMNHSGLSGDVSEGYLAPEAKILSLRPLYEQHERLILTQAGLGHLLPAQPADFDPKSLTRHLSDAQRAALLADLMSQR